MNENKIIFLGVATNREEFYALFDDKKLKQSVPEIFEDVQFYKTENIINIREDEIKKHFGDYKSIEELREIAIKYFADNIQGHPVDIGKYKNIRISRNSRDKYKSFSSDERKLLIIPKLLDVLKTSKYEKTLDPYKKRKDQIFKFHYFTNKIFIYNKKERKNKEYFVYITIGEDYKGNLFYDLEENKRS